MRKVLQIKREGKERIRLQNSRKQSVNSSKKGKEEKDEAAVSGFAVLFSDFFSSGYIH